MQTAIPRKAVTPDFDRFEIGTGVLGTLGDILRDAIDGLGGLDHGSGHRVLSPALRHFRNSKLRLECQGIFQILAGTMIKAVLATMSETASGSTLRISSKNAAGNRSGPRPRSRRAHG